MEAKMQDARMWAQKIRVVGAIVFVTGAILARHGTTSTALLTVYVLVAFGGFAAVALGQSEYRNALR